MTEEAELSYYRPAAVVPTASAQWVHQMQPTTCNMFFMAFEL